ncbi:MAG: right-handed parallel beta-helix repeat-containing protein [Candidatus Eremiobacteraeota bacterium]|nr:right-handed parallel beta-helix repeat-containing protein [Candidatus Eremiobacteraeota bacterium]
MQHRKRKPFSLILIIPALTMTFIAFLNLLAGCGGAGTTESFYQGGWNGGSSATDGTGPQVESASNLNNPGQPLALGDWLQINGTNFGSTQGSSYVAFTNGSGLNTQADIYALWTDTQVVCRVPLTLTGKKSLQCLNQNKSGPAWAQAWKSGGSSWLGACAVSAVAIQPSSPHLCTKDDERVANLGGPMLLPMLVVGGVAAAIVNATVNSNQHNADPQPTPPIPSPSPSPTPSPTLSVSPSPSPSPTPTVSPTPSVSPSPASSPGGGGGGGGTTWAPTIGSYQYTGKETALKKRGTGRPRDTHTVTSAVDSADTGSGSLREAITNAADGDTINFTDGLGTITLTLGELAITGKSITIDGSSSSTPITVDASATTSRVFNIGANATVTIKSLIMKGGNVKNDVTNPNGGTIYADTSSKLTLTGCTVDGSTAIQGGGIYAADGASLKMERCTVSNCVAAAALNGGGGGIYGAGTATMELTDCTVKNNTAKIMVDVTSGRGGGIFVEGPATAKLTNCTINSNTSENTTLGSGGGGGLYLSSVLAPAVAGSLSLVNCTIALNTASTDGGGIFSSSIAPAATITNSTISDNTSAGAGGGFACRAADGAHLLNTVVINNHDGSGAEDISNGGADINVYYCWYSKTSGEIATKTMAPNVTSAYDALKGLVALSLNSPGTTETMAVMAGCPAINTGTYVYFNAAYGYYFKGNDGIYYTLVPFGTHIPGDPSADRITTDQRGEKRQQ